jgi:hypothetical protein
VSVQQRFRVPLIEMNVAEARGAKESAVRDGTRSDVDRNADNARAYGVPSAGDAIRQGSWSPEAAEAEAEAAQARVWAPAQARVGSRRSSSS